MNAPKLRRPDAGNTIRARYFNKVDVEGIMIVVDALTI
jgi:hypothetical protein